MYTPMRGGGGRLLAGSWGGSEGRGVWRSDSWCAEKRARNYLRCVTRDWRWFSYKREARRPGVFSRARLSVVVRSLDMT